MGLPDPAPPRSPPDEVDRPRRTTTVELLPVSTQATTLSRVNRRQFIVAAGALVLVGCFRSTERVAAPPKTQRGRVVDVTAPPYGATGDGATNDTLEIQKAMDAAPAGATVLFPPGSYLVDQLTISEPNRVRLSGHGAELVLTTGGTPGRTAIKPTGTVTSLSIEGFTITGSGSVTDAHCGIGNDSGVTFTDLRIVGNRVTGCTVGISVNADLAGTIDGALIQGNTVVGSPGTQPGAGYGIHHASADYTRAANVRIIGNTVVGAGRHAIYQAKGRGVVISGNTIERHRDTARTGDILSAINCARSVDVTITGNTVLSSAGGALYVGGPEGGLEAGDVTVAGNTFSGATDVVQLVTIGQEDPTTEGVPDGVAFTGNRVQRTDGAGSCMSILNGRRVEVVGNLFRLTGTTALTTMLSVTGTGDEPGGNRYTDEVTVRDNWFVSGGTGVTNPVRLSGAERLRARLSFRDNTHVDGAPGEFFVLSVPSDNPNLDVQGQPREGLVMAP
jgi:Pectate lyase superfamily protein